jgi:hypothetical protein
MRALGEVFAMSSRNPLLIAVSLCARIKVPGPLVMIALLVSRSPFYVAELRHSNLVHNAQLEQHLPAARSSTVSSARAG